MADFLQEKLDCITPALQLTMPQEGKAPIQAVQNGTVFLAWVIALSHHLSLGEDTMAKTFKVGDLVELKSGGPPMTVEHEADAQGLIYCTWFAGKKAEWKRFNPDALKPYKEESEKKES